MQEIDYSIKNEISSLLMERDILTKTIFRVYQQDSQITKIQRDKLLTRYQHQLGVVVAKIEELGDAMKRKTTNPLDQGLFAVMEQKLSSIEERLQDLSSNIGSSHKNMEKVRQKSVKISHQTRKKSGNLANLNLNSNKHLPIEITTLTEVPNKIPEFFRNEFRPSQSKIEDIKPEYNEKSVKTTKNVDSVKVTMSNICEHPSCDNPKFSKKHCSKHTNSDLKESGSSEKQDTVSDLEVEKSEQEFKTDVKLLNDNNLDDDDDDDLSTVKNAIEKSLSALDQAEVE